MGELGTLLERPWRVQIVVAVLFSLPMKKAHDTRDTASASITLVSARLLCLCWHIRLSSGLFALALVTSVHAESVQAYGFIDLTYLLSSATLLGRVTGCIPSWTKRIGGEWWRFGVPSCGGE